MPPCHGKSVCDGIGGTVKRLAACSSLQRPVEGQILTPKELFTFCETKIHGITFFYISSHEIEEYREEQEKQFANAHTVSGPQDNHQYLPPRDAKCEQSFHIFTQFHSQCCYPK